MNDTTIAKDPDDHLSEADFDFDPELEWDWHSFRDEGNIPPELMTIGVYPEHHLAITTTTPFDD